MGGMRQFGDEMRRLRLAAGLSQDRLADQAGVTAKTIRSLENNDASRPRASTLGRLFDALGLDGEKRQMMLELLGGSGGSSAASTATEPLSDKATPPSEAPDRTDSELAALVRALRSANGWTQRELANRAGVHHRTISDLERGTTTSAQPGTAFRIAQAAGLRGDELDRFVAVATGTFTVSPTTPVGPEDLYGRVEELKKLLDLVAENRFVAIVGTGGVGKTSLALAAASAIGSAPGVGEPVVVELADQAAGTSLTTALSEALGTDGAGIADLVAGLGDRRLVVVDNVEHLVEVESTLTQLLESLPGTNFIGTSRSPIRLPGEPEASLLLEPLEPLAAVTLLRQRAAEAGCTEAWVIDDGPYEEICEGIDHLPLAIELAAAWSPLLSPEDLLDRLRAPLTLLDRGGPGRHGSVRSIVDWTLGLLSTSTVELFAELSVHPTSFTLDLAERLHDDDGRLLDGLRELVDAGLVSVIGHESTTRFRMLRVVREAGEALLEDDDRRAALADRRAEWALDLASANDAALTGSEQAQRLRRLDLEREHINLAFDHLIGAGSKASVDLVAGMWRYWHLRSLYVRGRDRITAAIALEEAESSGRFATAQYGRAVLGYLAGDVDRAFEDAKASLATNKTTGDQHGIGAVSSLLGMIDQYRSDIEASEHWYRSGLEMISPRSAPRAYATLQTNLGSLLGQLGRLDEAIELVEEANARFETLGDERGVADGAGNMALWELALGSPQAAKGTLQSVLAIFESLGDPQGEADTRLGLAEAALFLGDLTLAEVELEKASAIIEEVDDPWGLTLVAAHRSMVYLLRGQSEAALREARRARVEANSLPYEYAQLRAYLVEAVCRAEQASDSRAAAAASHGLGLSQGNRTASALFGLLLSALAVRQATGSVGPVQKTLMAESFAVLQSVAAAPIVDRICRLGGDELSPLDAPAAKSPNAVDVEDFRRRALEFAAELTT